MSLIDKIRRPQNTEAGANDEVGKWKHKYYGQIDKQEEIESLNAKNDELYRQTLNRLCLIVRGLHLELDPHLLKIRKSLKSGIKSADLTYLLEAFSKTLLEFDESVKKPNVEKSTTLLFDYLITQDHSAETIEAVNGLCEQFEAGKLPDTAKLIALINKLCAPNTLEVDESPVKLSGLAADLDIHAISLQFIELIQGSDIPNTSQKEADRIVSVLQAEQTEANFQQNVDAALVLLQNVKQHSQHEKKEMESFLALVTQQLSSLATGTGDANNLYEETQKQKQRFNQALDEKVQALQLHSEKATKLEPLKELIKDELTVLKAHIETHKKEEKVRTQKSNKKFAQMTSEIESMKQEAQSLEENLQKASIQAFTDKLTQLPNRLAYDQHFDVEFARWQRNGSALSLLVWDIDLFKNINDTYGHKAGDKTLSIIASLLKKYCRQTDFVSRFGGEEFTMLLANTDKKSALVLAEKIRRIIEKTGFIYMGKEIKITISCGISDLQEGDTQDSIFNRADKALYKAKKDGRNRSLISE